ncbi:MAG: M20/M25/M40 family metallo-hydrolase, partial [Bacteroidales bacterium]|nr:M20/M25/M40 family metallo-hydrolase [Bacteroidales bacterium]
MMDTELIDLLKGMVSIPSFSREEGPVADFIEGWLRTHGLNPSRKANNLWLDSDPGSDKPLLILNGHIDTVKPAGGYSRDPFTPSDEDGRIRGHGTNDDGASDVALLGAYLKLLEK